MHRNTSEDEIRKWPQDAALRRYQMILDKLSVKQGGR